MQFLGFIGLHGCGTSDLGTRHRHAASKVLGHHRGSGSEELLLSSPRIAHLALSCEMSLTPSKHNGNVHLI